MWFIGVVSRGNLWQPACSDISDNWISMSSKGFNQHFIVKKRDGYSGMIPICWSLAKSDGDRIIISQN